MGRSGYTETDDWDETWQWAMIRQGGARKQALRSKRGQDFLRRLAAALDAMPVKSLCQIPSSDDGHFDHEKQKYICPDGADRLGLADGSVCVLGALALAEGKTPAEIDATDHDKLSQMFNVAPTLIKDLEWENDQRYAVGPEAATEGELRWKAMREWVEGHLAKPAAQAG